MEVDVMSEQLLRVKDYLISNELFEKGYAAGNGPCTCSAQCCRSGVWVDVREHDAILERKELIRQQMDETQTPDERKWFDTHIEDDPDFPSGRCIGTAVVNDKCAFLDKAGRCSIQRAAVAAGEHKWAWKPTFCVLFPIVIENGIIEFDPMLQGEQMCCSITSAFDVPLFVACKEELIYLLGEDGYHRIETHYASRNKAQHEIVTAG
jgi:Fe-S-cluster containining protein